MRMKPKVIIIASIVVAAAVLTSVFFLVNIFGLSKALVTGIKGISTSISRAVKKSQEPVDKGSIKKAIDILLEEDAKEMDEFEKMKEAAANGDDTGQETDISIENSPAGHVENEESSEKPVQDNVKVKTNDKERSENFINYKKPHGTAASQKAIDNGDVVNILLLGIDRTLARDKTLKVYRTDTIAIASVNVETKEVHTLCIPRDTYVYIPEIDKKDKINHAYVWGGMGENGIKSTIETIEQFVKYGSIDYYFAIDMEPVPDIVDDIGGVELDVEIDMKTNGADLSKGMQVLDGKKASTYIRWRYSAGGDIDRIKRQQKLAKALFEKLRESDRLMDGVKIVLNYNKYVKTNMSVMSIASLIPTLKSISGENVTSCIIPGSSRTIDKIWYWMPDEKKTDELLKDFFAVK